MLSGGGSRYRTYLETMEKELERLESGDLTGLRCVYSAFATRDGKLMERAGEAVRRQLSPMADMQLLRLCERFRTFISLEWAAEWADVEPGRIQKVLSGEAYRYVLILGSFHPNGYFREKCVYAMAGLEGTLFWLFPRMNDWVPQVRDAAGRALDRNLGDCGTEELMESLPAFERLKAGHRRAEGSMLALERRVEGKLSCALKGMDTGEISGMEPAVRSALYRTAVDGGLWSLRDMEDCLAGERSSCLKRFLARAILSRPDCTPERAEHYLRDASSQVRRLAVEYRYEHLKTGWPGLERMLLDKSRGVREYAAYILERQGGFDIRGYYLEHMKTDRPEYAILGLAEYSRKGNVPALLECLLRPERSILKCTLLALGCQEDFGDGELLWRYLPDDRIELSKAAYLSIRKKGFRFEAGRIYRAYLEARDGYQRRYLLNLLLAEGSWERLPCLLRLYRGGMPEQERLRILVGIHSRFMYAKVPEALRADILLALEECRGELPGGVEDGILYDLKFL